MSSAESLIERGCGNSPSRAACRHVGHGTEPSVRWLDPNCVIDGCTNSLFAAKISFLGPGNGRARARPSTLSKEFVSLSLAAQIGPEGRRFAGALGIGAGVLSRRFESYPLVPGCHTLLVLHGIAEPFGGDAELA